MANCIKTLLKTATQQEKPSHPIFFSRCGSAPLLQTREVLSETKENNRFITRQSRSGISRKTTPRISLIPCQRTLLNLSEEQGETKPALRGETTVDKCMTNYQGESPVNNSATSVPAIRINHPGRFFLRANSDAHPFCMLTGVWKNEKLRWRKNGRMLMLAKAKFAREPCLEVLRKIWRLLYLNRRSENNLDHSTTVLKHSTTIRRHQRAEHREIAFNLLRKLFSTLFVFVM